MSSSARQEPPSALLQVLQAGEKILWWERCSRRLDGFATVLFLASIPPLIIYADLLWDCMEPGGMNPEEAKELLFLPGLSLCCILLAGYQMLTLIRTIYALTNRRGVIIERAPLYRRIHSADITPHFVRKLTRHRNGTASYIIAEQHIGNMALPIGFQGVRQVSQLEEQLCRCGVLIPQVPPPSAPSGKLLLLLLLLPLGIISLGLHRLHVEADLQLPLYGESAVATIQGFRPHTQTEGRKARKLVTRYYPILQFRLPNGTTSQAVDLIGDKRPMGLIGDEVDILYFPQQPHIAMRSTSRRFGWHIFILLMFTGSVGALGYHLLRLYRYHHQQKSAEIGK